MSAAGPNLVSVLTPPGRGAVAVVAARGPQVFEAIDASFQPANGRSIAKQRPNRILFGHWTSGDHREEVVVLRADDDSAEVHCHGGAAAVGRIVDALVSHGCKQLPWQEWLETACSDIITVEVDQALAQATPRRAAGILLNQRNGAFSKAVQEIRLALVQQETAIANRMISELISRSELGAHLTAPWQVAIAGRPNVGKSSLINALVGYQRAIVFDQPGTTRDVLSAETAIDGWPVRLTDAAGIRATDDPLESEGVARAREQLGCADLVLWIIDATALSPRQPLADQAFLKLAAESERSAFEQEPLIVVNKTDLLSADAAIASTNDVIAVSALTRYGLGELLQAISKRLVPTPPTSGEAVPFTERQLDHLRQAQAAITAGNLSAVTTALDSLAPATTTL